MTYIALIIYLTTMGGVEYGTEIPFHDRASCEAAMLALAPAMQQDWPDYDMRCIDTGVVWKSPIPKPRPLEK